MSYHPTFKKIRLIYSSTSQPPPGSIGTLISFWENFYIILWENYDIEVGSNIESSTFFADEIIEGYSLLTMDDVLRLSNNDWQSLFLIKDQEKIHRILLEFQHFTLPLQKKNHSHEILEMLPFSYNKPGKVGIYYEKVILFHRLSFMLHPYWITLYSSNFCGNQNSGTKLSIQYSLSF